MSTEPGTYKFYYTNGEMIKYEFDNDNQASGFAQLEGDHLLRWCENRDGQDYDFVNGVWVEV